jgi:hypothetical protein
LHGLKSRHYIETSGSLKLFLRSFSMKRKLLYGMIAASLLAGLSVAALAQDQDRDKLQTQDKDQTRDQLRTRDRDIYGSQLMTTEERNEYHAKMRAAKTAQEREQIRKEHHERMKVRAKEKGVTIPDEPPERGKGMGPRDGMGPGGSMGSGNGMGPGGGMGSGGGMGPGMGGRR